METTLARVSLVADSDALVGLYFPEHHPSPPASVFGEHVDADGDDLLARAAEELREYIAGERRAFDVSVATRGDAFQTRVWALLRGIPYGTTTTYGALAEALGDRTLARRVGQAVGRNPVSVLVPCHRVIGADGSLTGYAGGLDVKRRLLELEGAASTATPRLFA